MSHEDAYLELASRIAYEEDPGVSDDDFALLLSANNRTPEEFAADVDIIAKSAAAGELRLIVSEATIELASRQARAAANVFGE